MSSDQASLLPSEVDLKLRLGIYRLLDARYRPSFGDQTKFLCAGILNRILCEPPGNQNARDFCKAHTGLIEREAATVHLDPKLSLAISLLYTLTLVRLGPNGPEKAFDLAEKATKLNIIVLSTEEVCKPRGISIVSDAREYLTVIDQYASELLQEWGGAGGRVARLTNSSVGCPVQGRAAALSGGFRFPL